MGATIGLQWTQRIVKNLYPDMLSHSSKPAALCLQTTHNLRKIEPVDYLRLCLWGLSFSQQKRGFFSAEYNPQFIQ